MRVFGEAAGVEPHRLAQKGVADPRPPAVGRPVLRGAPDDGRLVADFPAGPAIVSQRRRRPRTLAVAAQIERHRRPGRAARLVADQVGRGQLRATMSRAVFLNFLLFQRRQRSQIFQAAHAGPARSRLSRNGVGRRDNCPTRGTTESADGRVAVGESLPAAETASARTRAGSAIGPSRRGARGPAASARRARCVGRAA